MYGVDGSELVIWGQISLTICVGPERLKQTFLVADLEESAILGYDFLHSHQVEWMWKDQSLRISKTVVPCNMNHEYQRH